MTQKIIWLLMLVLCFAVALVVDTIRGARRRERTIRNAFGKVPSGMFRRTRIPHYWRQVQRYTPVEGDVDDTTWNDLRLDDVYESINACQSAIGEDYLYAMLRRPVQKAPILQDRECLMKALSDEPLRIKVQVLLAKLGRRVGADLPALLFSTDDFALQSQVHFWLGALALPVCVALCFWNIQLGLTLLVLTAVHNVWLFLRTQKLLGDRIETMGYLLAALGCASKLQTATEKCCPRYAALLQEVLVPLRKTGVSVVNLATPATDTDLGGMIRSVLMITLLPVLQYCRSVKRLTQQKAQLQMLYCLLGELDAAACVLSYRHSLPLFAIPEFTNTLCVHAKGLVHPLLTQGIPNDANITQSWLLTGSNASGKSTFLKAVAINCIMAQTIHTCTAQSYCMMLGPVITSMAVEDSVVEGESYFIAEIKSMRRIVAAVDTGVPCYCFIDEILKGTNTVERVAASNAILCYLHVPHCLCLAATHDIELTQQLADAYQNLHFSEEISENGVAFDYTLKQGRCNTRNAIRLLGVYAFPDEIVAQAQRQASIAQV